MSSPPAPVQAQAQAQAQAHAQAVDHDITEDDLRFSTFFAALLNADQDERRSAMQNIQQRLLASALLSKQSKDAGLTSTTSPQSSSSHTPTSTSSSIHHASSSHPTHTHTHTHAHEQPPSHKLSQLLITVHLPSIIRLSLECPYGDVRAACKSLITKLVEIDDIYAELRPPTLGPSLYVPPEQTPTYYVDDSVRDEIQEEEEEIQENEEQTQDSLQQQTQGMFEDLFLATGRVSHVEALMGWHPSFLSAYTQSLHFILYDNGPLPIPWRHYLAIVAVWRYHCDSLQALYEHEFIASGGDVTWLKSVENAPKKLQALLELNAILAHQPWLITKDDIARLVKDAGTDSWSISELVHAFVILTTFHSLCGFVYAMGVTPEVDMTDLTLYRKRAKKDEPTGTTTTSASITSTSASTSTSTSTQDKSEGEHLFKLLQSNADDDINKGDCNFNLCETDDNIFARAGTTPPSSLIASFESKMSSGVLAETLARTVINDTNADAVRHRYAGNIPARLINLRYIPFDVNSKSYSTFYMHEYSWKEHGFPLVNRFYQGFGQLLDLEFDLIYNLTYNTVSDKTNIDTGPFRRAVWYYTHRLYGMCHDDYAYHKIPIFLGPSIKSFIKKCACYPDQMSASDFALRGYNFKPDEKAHVALLVMEGHRQAALLYGLHAVMGYMTTDR